MSEQEFIRWFRDRLPPAPADVVVGAGPDDCAILNVSLDTTLALTTDTLLEGTHFRPEDNPREVGWKAIAVNLSDLAASGCHPRWAVIAAGLRRDLPRQWVRDLALGMLDAAAEYNLHLVGGDTTSGEGPTSLSVTALGSPMKNKACLRSGAKPGDIAVVTGALGGSLLGRHLRPLPRLPEMALLLKHGTVHGAMDISDGLGLDLNRMCDESGCGVRVDVSEIPIHADAETLSHSTGRSALAHALTDGEDFELLLAMTPSCWPRVCRVWDQQCPELGLHRIGEFTKSKRRLLLQDTGAIPLKANGYEHKFGS